MDSDGKKTGGRKPGSKNRIPTELKAMVEEAFMKAGGVRYLVKQSKDNPVAFMALLARLLPKQVAGEVKLTGEFTLIDLLTKVDARAPIETAQPKPH